MHALPAGPHAAAIDQMLTYTGVGTADQAIAYLAQIAAEAHADELMSPSTPTASRRGSRRSSAWATSAGSITTA